MEHKLLKELSKFPEAKKNFLQMFSYASEKFLDNARIVKIKEGMRFVTAGEKIELVWILLKGQVKVVDEHISGDIYIFTKFNALEVFGEREGVGEVENFHASLVADTDCLFLTIPLNLYIEFLKENPEIFYNRVKKILRHTLDEGRENRIYLRMKAIDRLKLYFIKQYKNYAVKNLCELNITRQQIANETGYSVKTINRNVKSLDEENFLDIKGQRILISKNQYDAMVKSVEKYFGY